MIRVIFPTDEHYPYQDDKAIQVAMRIANDFDPHIRITGSDGLDFYSLSKYDKNPLRMKSVNLQDELDAWQAGQRAWLDATPNAKPRYIIGNHEDRLRRYLWRHPELSDLEALKLPSLLRFWQLNIDDVEEEVVINKKLVVRHGSIIRKHAAYTARGELESERYQISVMTGHTHRGGLTMAAGRFDIVKAAECFCLCRLDPEYIDRPDWQQGLAMAMVAGQSVQIELVPFFKHRGKTKAIWRDREYSA